MQIPLHIKLSRLLSGGRLFLFPQKFIQKRLLLPDSVKPGHERPPVAERKGPYVTAGYLVQVGYDHALVLFPVDGLMRWLPVIEFPATDPGFSHTFMNRIELVLRHHHMQMDISFTLMNVHRSSSRLRLRRGGSFTLSSGLTSGTGTEGGTGKAVLFGIPSIILQFCSVESSAFFR